MATHKARCLKRRLKSGKECLNSSDEKEGLDSDGNYEYVESELDSEGYYIADYEAGDWDFNVTMRSFRNPKSSMCHSRGSYPPKSASYDVSDVSSDMRAFARWAFGPLGLPHLHVHVYGDIAHPAALWCSSGATLSQTSQ